MDENNLKWIFIFKTNVLQDLDERNYHQKSLKERLL